MPLVDRGQIMLKRAARLEELRRDPLKFQAACIHYKTHPWDFIDDWCMTQDPRLYPSEIPFIMFPRQREWIIWLYQHWKDKNDGLTEKSRDMGVTWLCCAFATWLWLFYGGQAVAFGSRKEDLVDKLGDPKCIFEKIRFILRNLPNEFLPKGYDERRHAAFLRIVNPENGSTITGEAGDNIGRGGRSSIYFKDESAFYERADKIEAALSMNSDVKIDVSTPNGTGNPFYRKRMSGKIDVFTFHWTDDPRKDKAWYEKQLRILDPIILAQEVEIDYNASVSNNLINGSLVTDAMKRHVDFEIFGPKILGVDPARFGDDRTALVMRQGRAVHWIETHKKLDTNEIVGRIDRYIRHYWFDVVVVDVVGLGAGVYDALSEKWGDRIIAFSAAETALDPVNYKDRRTEAWVRMRDWFQQEKPVICHHDDLVADCATIQYHYNSSGQMQLESKKDMKRRGVKSPDIGDALAMTLSDDFEYYSEFESEESYHSVGAGGY